MRPLPHIITESFRSAMMFPYAPAPGTISGTRPTTQQSDAPLADDDRTGLRVLDRDPVDTFHQGSIGGKIIPANPLALPAFPPGVTGVFGSHVVAVDNSTGAVIGATLGGWSCRAGARAVRRHLPNCRIARRKQLHGLHGSPQRRRKSFTIQQRERFSLPQCNDRCRMAPVASLHRSGGGH